METRLILKTDSRLVMISMIIVFVAISLYIICTPFLKVSVGTMTQGWLSYVFALIIVELGLAG